MTTEVRCQIHGTECDNSAKRRHYFIRVDFRTFGQIKADDQVCLNYMRYRVVSAEHIAGTANVELTLSRPGKLISVVRPAHTIIEIAR